MPMIKHIHNMKIFYICFWLLLGLMQIGYAQKTTLYGKVVSANNGEVLIGALIVDPNTQATAITDQFGRYSLETTFIGDSVSIEVLSMGYLKQKHIFTPFQKTILQNWSLVQSSQQLAEVEIEGSSNQYISENQTSGFKIAPIELKSAPSIGGEKDLLKMIQLTPGIQISNDFNSNLFVRGGDYDQNLFLLDNMPLYHVNHAGGFLSTFNADIIKSAEILKGDQSAKYGGRLSSVVNINTIDGDMNHYNYNFNLGLISSKIMINGPIVKNKASFVASFRINSPIVRYTFGAFKFLFYDANVKLNWEISKKDRIYFSFYNGYDNIGIKFGEDSVLTSNLSAGWGNLASSLRYNKVFSSKLFADFIVGYSQYKYEENSDIQFFADKKIFKNLNNQFKSQISESFLKAHFNYFINNSWSLCTGLESSLIQFEPGASVIKIQVIEEDLIQDDVSYPLTKSFENAFFIEAIGKEVYGFNFNIGLRGQWVNIKNDNFLTLQPRVFVSKSLGKLFAIKASYSRLTQNFHMVANEGGGIPVEYRLPASQFAPPSISDQVVLGATFSPKKSSYFFSIEGYYKKMDHLVTLKEGVYFTLDFRDFENILYTNGKGKSKGVEFYIRKTKGKSTGWVASTLSKTTRQFAEINNGTPYPFKFDRRFDLKIFLQRAITHRFSVSFSWAFATGNAFTLPIGSYVDINGNSILVYGPRNSFREESYHRLDVGFQYQFIIRKKINCTLDFNIVNLYNRKNPFFYYINYNGTTTPKVYVQHQFPLFPSINICFKNL